MFGNLGFWEILLIVLIVALLFGGKKLPQVGKGLGDAITQFKDAIKGEKNKEPKIEDKDKNIN